MTNRSAFLSLLPATLLLGLSAGCAVQTSEDDAHATGTTEEAMVVCRLPQVTPSVVGTLGVPPLTPQGPGPGAPVLGQSSPGYQTTNCQGTYEIEAEMPASEPTPPQTELVIFQVDTLELNARSDCATALHMSYSIQGMQNGTWVPIENGLGKTWLGTNSCEISGFASLTLTQAEAYTGFRLAGSAYLKEGSVVTYLPVFLEIQQDPTF